MKALHNIQLPLIAILRGIRSEEVLEHAKVLYAEGFEMIEVPTNSPNWRESVALLVEHFGDSALIGAGTVITEDHYSELQQTGGKLLVTPNFNPTIIQRAITDGFTTCIGAFSPTEVIAAAQLGVSVVKVFPAGNAGLSYCKAIMAVAPKQTSYYCVGGINSENLSDYLAIGFSGAGLGSDLYKPGQSVETTRTNAQRYVAAYKKHQDEN